MSEEFKQDYLLEGGQDINEVMFVLETLIRPMLEQGQKFQLTIKAPKDIRTLQQNKLLHKVCGEASKSLEFAGTMRTTEEWKRVFASGYMYSVTKEARVFPGIEGEFVSLAPSTSQMGVKRMTDLIEYSTAYCQDRGVYVGFW